MFCDQVIQLEKELIYQCQNGKEFLDAGKDLLSQYDFSKTLSLGEIQEYFLNCDIAQDYSPEGFADFNLTLVTNSLFSINLYFWGEKQTPMHAHPCDGIVQVLEGCTVELKCNFEVVNIIADGIEEVKLKNESIEKYGPGDIFTFCSNKLSAHIPVKVGSGNISLVIRGKNLREGQVRFAYPNLCFSGFSSNQKLERVLYLLERQLENDEKVQGAIKKVVKTISPAELLYSLFLGKRHFLYEAKIKKMVIRELSHDYKSFFELLDHSNMATRDLMKKLMFLAR